MLVKWKNMMKKQTGRKNKVLQINYVEKYKDQFLQLGQNNEINIHFKTGKHWMIEEMNRSLLEKIRWLLSNAQLDKSFWAKTLKYVGHFMNILLLTVIRDKTLLDVWSGELAHDYDFL